MNLPSRFLKFGVRGRGVESEGEDRITCVRESAEVNRVVLSRELRILQMKR